MIKIAPSILSADFARLGEEVGALAEAGADYVHVDVMDGHFVPNLTIGPPVVKALRGITDLPLDVHLMVDNPDMYLEGYAGAGSDLIGVHAEVCTHLHRSLARIRELGAKASVVLNPHTPLCMIENVLDMVDMILIMSVNPGFGGQKFIPSALEKTRRLKQMLEDRGLSPDIQLDGGIAASTIAGAAGAGANVFVSGTGVFGHKDGYAAAIRELRELAEKAYPG